MRWTTKWRLEASFVTCVNHNILWFSSAIYCVNHNILLTKLEFYGITGVPYKLIKSYLGGRYQRVVLNNHSPSLYSKWSEITHGVSQGSVLGPLLFLLYLNDLPQITNDTNSKTVLFADDTSTIIITNPKFTDFVNSVNKIFQHINEWFSAILLSLNLDKTYYMQFVTKNSSLINFNITYGNKKMADTCNTKFLELTLKNSLSWKTHIDTIVLKFSNLCDKSS